MAKTVRVTIRLPEEEVTMMDTLVDAGEYGSRSEFIRHAVRELNNRAADKVKETIETRKEFADTYTQLQQMKQQMQEMQDTISKLAQK